MNGLQTLINQWTRIDSVGDLTLYSNDTIALPSFIVIDPEPAIVSLEVFRALGYQPPFADQPTAMAAMQQLAAMGGSAAIPGIIGQAAPPPIAVAPVAPVAIPAIEHLIAPVPEPPIVAELPIVHELIGGLVDMDTVPADDLPGVDYSDPDPLPAPEPTIVTPVAAPIQYPTADDYQGSPIARVLAEAQSFTDNLQAVVSDHLDLIQRACAAIATDAIANKLPQSIAPADPDTRSMPSIARSTKADGFKWYLMIGPLTNLTEAQAIEQQTNLLKAAKFTRTPKLDPPGDNDVEGFGEVWYSPISESQAARLAWMDGTQLSVHNM
jgi:hypothetical protein